MTQTGIFNGRVLVPYAYGRYGYTRGVGKTWQSWATAHPYSWVLWIRKKLIRFGSDH